MSAKMPENNAHSLLLVGDKTLDVFYEMWFYELKFTSKLSHTHFYFI